LLRDLIFSLATRRPIARTVTSGVGRRVALRFVAGEELDDAVAAVKRLNAMGASVSLDYLGEHCTESAIAEASATTYRRMLERIQGDKLDANVSVKLTQLGLDIDQELALGNAALVVMRAAEAGTTVTLDMEDHPYTDRTIEVCVRLADRFPGRVGVALQAYLRRTPADLERVVAQRVPVRLCKGAYREPTSIAYQSRRDVDAAFARLARRLVESQAYPMIATHDERLIRHASRLGRPRDSWEIQMLYGVRRDLQRKLIEEGYRLRVYVPFGREWYPYLARRIAERPANVRFFAEALLRG
jgi:proline dehydrogenase